MANRQGGGRRLALRASLHPQLTRWLDFGWFGEYLNTTPLVVQPVACALYTDYTILVRTTTGS